MVPYKVGDIVVGEASGSKYKVVRVKEGDGDYEYYNGITPYPAIYHSDVDHEASAKINRAKDKVIMYSNPTKSCDWLQNRMWKQYVFGSWRQKEDTFTPAKEDLMKAHPDIKGVYRNTSKTGMETTTCVLVSGYHGVVSRYHKDETDDTVAVYEAYTKALKNEFADW